METDADEGLRGIRTDSSDIIATGVEGGVNWDKAILSTAGLEGKPGKGIGKTNADAPVILSFSSNQPFPPNNAPAQSSAPPVKYLIIHPTTHLPMRKSCYESPRPRYIERSTAGRVVPSEVLHGQRTAQGDDSHLRGKKPRACDSDVGTPMVGLRGARLLEPGYVGHSGGQAGRQHWMGLSRLN